MSKDNNEGAASRLLECIQQLSLADVQAMPLQQWFVLIAAAAAVATPIFGVGYAIGRGKEKAKMAELEREIRDLRDPARPSDKVVVEELQKARSHAAELRQELGLARTRLTDYDRLRQALDGDNDELWRLHKSAVPHEALNAIHSSGVKVLVFANLKGGVGKTTTAVNLAAFYQSVGYRVLLIDLDYQGSLTSTVQNAAHKQPSTIADKIISGEMAVEQFDPAVYNLGSDLANLSLVPTGYRLNQQEQRKLTRWLLNLEPLDPRYTLARFLAHKKIPDAYDIVIVDTPPRLSLGAINGLAAATHVVIPTILDGMSAENVATFIRQLQEWFVNDLNPRLQIAGVIGTMTPTNKHASGFAEDTTQERALVRIRDDTLDTTGVGAPHIFDHTVPDTARFAQDAGRTIAYLDKRATNAATRKVIEDLGQEVATRIGLKARRGA
jgi:cellulose biosynthesis protein BcsQ